MDLRAQATGGLQGASLTLNGLDSQPGLIFSANEEAGNGASIFGYNPAGVATFELDADDGQGGAYLSLRQDDGSPMVTLQSGSESHGNGSLLRLRQSSGDLGLTFYANEFNQEGRSCGGPTSPGRPPSNWTRTWAATVASIYAGATALP